MKYTDEDLARYCDGMLDAARTERLLQAAASDTELAEALSALEASRLPYKAAYRQQQVPEVPAALRRQVANLVSVTRSEAVEPQAAGVQRWQKFAVAACIAISFGCGFLLARQVETVSGSSVTGHVAQLPIADSNAQAARLSAAELDWVHRVADYQSLYVPATVNHIKDGASRATALLSDISERSGMHTAMPDLTASGYQFVRAQELGYEGDTLVQLVYAKEGKIPLALCYMPAAANDDSGATVLRHSGLGVVFWQTATQRFVIVADEAPDELEQLYQQAHATWL